MNFERALEQVADKYRCEGYQVVLHPGPGQLPAFAGGAGVPILAFKDGEKVLVQVKARTEDLRDAPDSRRLAEAVSGQPGWRFDLVVLNADRPAYQVPPDAGEPPVEKIQENLADAERLSRAGDLPAACVLSWAALEAALRRVGRALGIDAANADSTFLLRALYSNGPLTREELDGLGDVLKVRNALAHGLTVPSLGPEIPQYIAGVARRLLFGNGKGHDGTPSAAQEKGPPVATGGPG